MSEGPISAGTLTVRLVSDAGTLPGDVKRQVDQAAAGAQQGLSTSERDLTGKARTIGNRASLFMTVPLLAAGKAAIDAGSDVIESTNKVNVVFGKSGAQVLTWSDGTSKAFGVSKRAALDYAGVFGALLRPMGLTEKQSASMSTKLVNLAGDMASFNNANPEEVLEALRSGMVGETEPLRRFGINLNQTRVEAEAYRLGLVKAAKDHGAIKIATERNTLAQAAYTKAVKDHGKNSEQAKRANVTREASERALQKAMAGHVPTLTGVQKAQATYSLIMHDSTLQQGDFQRSLSTSAANQARVNSAMADDARSKIGGQLLPAYRDALNIVGDVAGAFSGLSPHAQKAVVGLGLVAAAAGPLLRAGTSVVTITKGMYGGMASVVKGGAGLVGGFRDVNKAYADNASLATRVGAGVKSQLSAWSSQAGALASSAKAYAGATAELVKNTAQTLASRAAAAASAVAQRAIAAASTAWAAAQRLVNLALAANPIFLVIGLLALLVGGIVVAYKHSETFRNIINAAWKGIKAATGDMVSLMVRGFQMLADVWMTVVGTIVHGAASALGWVPGVGGKLKKASAAFDGFKRDVDSKLQAVAASANSWGEDSGHGFAKGLRNTQVDVQLSARQLADAVPKQLRNRLIISSPSKLLATIGRYAGQGFAKGLRGSVDEIASAATELANKVHDTIGKKGGLTAREATALTKHMRTAVAHLEQLTRQHDKVLDRLDAARQKLSELKQAAADYAAGIRDAVNATGDLTKVGADPDGGATTAGGILAGLQKAADAARAFQANMAKLLHRGLSATGLQQLYAGGVEGGGAAAAALAGASDAQLRQVNALQAQIDAAAKATGDQAKARMYDAGIQAAEGLVAGLESQEERLRKTMTRLADAIVDQVQSRLGIHSPSVVLAQQGRYAGQGLEVGARAQLPHVRAAGRALAEALVHPVPTQRLGAPRLGAGAAGVLELPAGAVRGGDGEVAVHVHPAPGMSEETVGRVAAHELEWQLR